MPEITERLGLTGILEIFERAPPKDKTPADADYFEGGWTFLRAEKNLIVNTGYYALANRLTGSGTYSSAPMTCFAWGDGTTAPALTRTAADFYSDCANSDTKTVTTIETFDTVNLKQIWSCFLASTDNAVTSIKKFALMNADPGTVMFNEIKFSSTISKNSYKEFYFRYNLLMSQV